MNVQFEERPAQHGYRIGIASLDAKRRVDVVFNIHHGLTRWMDKTSSTLRWKRR